MKNCNRIVSQQEIVASWWPTIGTFRKTELATLYFTMLIIYQQQTEIFSTYIQEILRFLTSQNYGH